MSTIEITKDNHDEVVASGIVALDVWASWCQPCKAFGPIFEEASNVHPDIKFGKLNSDEQQELSAQYGIRSIPTLMFYKDGELVYSKPGAIPRMELERLIMEARKLKV